jgi:predicted DsbA family dithiol-disulfide isomerase
MIVEIWSDVACPWCYIGKRRFERALVGFEGSDDVAITWRSFQLDPSIPSRVRVSHDQSLADKLGATPEQVAAMNERVTALAAAEGLDYHFERYMTVNTFDAHRITHFAKTRGRGAEMHERLFRGQFVEGAVLDDPDTLVRLAVEVGLPEDDARPVVESEAYASEVTDDIHEAQALGINGVPFFVIDRRFGISGAQSSDLIRSTLARARDEAPVPG